MSDDAAIVKEFLVESYENLDRLDQDLVVLEKDPTDRNTLASIFRTIHTIKGTSGFLAFNHLEAVTHAGESLLSRLRDGLLPLTAEITTAMLATVDAVREMLTSIEASGKEGERNDQELISTLTRLLEAQAVKPSSEAARAKTGPVATASAQPVPNLGDILIERGAAEVGDVHAAVEQQKAGDPRHVGEILVEKGTVKSQDIVEALNVQHQARGQSASDSTIRVDVGQLDRLMNRVGGTGSSAQPDRAVHQLHRRQRTARDQSAAEPAYYGTARGRDEDAHAADRQCLEQVPAYGARRGARVRQAGADRNGGEGHRTRQDHHRGHQRSTDPPGAERGRSRH